MDPTLIPALGGTVGLLSVAGWLVISFMRENSTLRNAWRGEIDALKKDLAAQKEENVTCRIQVNSLISYLQNNGLAIPMELIRGVPDAGH